MINLLYFCGMTGFVKETLLQRYFSPVSCQENFYLYLEFVVRSCCHPIATSTKICGEAWD